MDGVYVVVVGCAVGLVCYALGDAAWHLWLCWRGR